ncbi:MAG: polyprenyl diphosphate synthase [Phycisphaerales bacterium]
MNASQQKLGLPLELLPRHIAVVMDGNGRWAQRRGKDRTFGHAKGAEAVLPIVTECANLGLRALSLYALSHENLIRRPAHEVDCLMDLYEQYLQSERQKLIDNHLRFIHIGRREGLAEGVLRELDRTTEATRGNPGLTLALALNYGSRQEITDAVRALAAEVAAGKLTPDQIDEQRISDHLYTAGLPDPDLMIRTAGEMRLSNFLLWQISYGELWVTPDFWPDFTIEHLHQALRDYAGRTRRFGAVVTNTK